MSKIIKVIARQVYDSRGNPTIEAEVFTKNKSAKATILPIYKYVLDKCYLNNILILIKLNNLKTELNNGSIILELGGQKHSIEIKKKFFKRGWKNIKLINDFNGDTRILIAQN